MRSPTGFSSTQARSQSAEDSEQVRRNCSSSNCRQFDERSGEKTIGIQVGCIREIREMDHEFLDTGHLIGSQALTDGLKVTNEAICTAIYMEYGHRPSIDQSPCLLDGLSHEQYSELSTLVVP